MGAQGEDVRRGEAFALAAGFFNANRLVTAFLRERVRAWAPVEAAETEVDAVMYGQFLRVESWARTLVKLDEPADFQAVAAAARSMMEAAIDMALLQQAPDDYTKLLAWEESAKLKHAECLLRFLERAGDEPTQDQQHVIEWTQRNKANIEELRSKFGWVDSRTQKPRHPDRWTGRNLAEDAKAADGAGLRFGFEHFYETQYRAICWSVHGSAFAVRGVEAAEFPGIAGLLFPRCSDLALAASELLLRHFGVWDDDKVKALEELARQRVSKAETTRASKLGRPSP
jgi:hypothetical protein